jgi:hypothetical protein
MISFLLDTILYSSMWVMKQSYNGIYYVINGSEETTEEKLLKIMEENKEYQIEIKNLLQELNLEKNKNIN